MAPEFNAEQYAGLIGARCAEQLRHPFVGIMTRSGYHCAQPYHEALDLPGTVRASLYLSSVKDEVEALADALETIKRTIV